MKPRLMLRSMHGLGDNFYQRALIKYYVDSYDVWLDSPWPELYADLPVHLVRPVTRYRTQAKNIARHTKWEGQPYDWNPTPWHYAERKGSMLEALESAIKIRAADVIDFSGPRTEPIVRDRRYMVVRPATVRREWLAASRNADPNYIDQAAYRAAQLGYEVISIADLEPNQEWLIGDAPFAHVEYHKGELPLADLLRLVAGASGIISGVGWALPAALAYRVPMLCLFGGCGGHNAPSRVLDPRIDTRCVVAALPTNYCMCTDRDHDCDKRTDMEPYLDQYFRLAARTKAPVAS